MRKVIIILILFGFLLPSFSFSQEQPEIKAPESIEEVKELGKKALEVGEKELPGIIKRVWREEVLPVWQKMYDWFKAKIWAKIWPKVEEEIEKRKPLLKEEFEKEKEELKEELPKVGKSLWEKFKELLD